MSLAIFPVLVGQGWPERGNQLSTIAQTAESGHQVNIPSYLQARYRWMIPFGYLNQNYEIATADWQIITGFHEQMLGKATAFLFSDPSDNDTSQNVPGGPANPSPVNQNTIGIGDGSTTTFQLARVNAFGTPHLVYYVNSLNRAPRIYVNGSLVASGYTISSTGLVTFGTAPTSGYTVAWDGQFYFLVRFDDDKIDATNVAGPYWRLNEVNLLEAVGPNG
jgi:uncharacterized protein (TIGR02217 family)